MKIIFNTGEDIVSIYPKEEVLLRQIGGEEHVIRPSKGHYEEERLVVMGGSLIELELSNGQTTGRELYACRFR